MSVESEMLNEAPPAANRPSLAKRCFFKNAIIFRLPKDFALSSQELEAELSKRPLTECAPLETHRNGWVIPSPVGGRVVHTVNATQHLIALGTYTKILPGSVVREETNKRAQAMAEEQGYPVGRRQMRELKERVYAELLSKALVKTTVTRAWIDAANGWLVVEAAGAARAEKLVSFLRETLGSFGAVFLDPNISGDTAMAAWLRDGDAPLRFSLDSDLEMQSVDKSKATVRYSRHTLEGQDVQIHLNSGKHVTRLGLTWSDRISLVLNYKLELKKITYLELETKEDAAESVEEQFDADLLMMTADFAQLIGDLTQALGGLPEQEA